MSDKILILYSPLADFSTAPWGVLKVLDGKIVLDKVKAFNRARRMLNAGANGFRILRRGIWETQVPFDYKDPGYWPLIKEYAAILHQPSQKMTAAQKGAKVIIDPFDGCSEDWFYHDHDEARILLGRFFKEFQDMPFVEFSAANEANNEDESVRFMENCLFPFFKDNGKMPFAYGATYKRTDPPTAGLLERQKAKADQAWQGETSKIIYRAVHGVMDAKSENLIDTFEFWAKKAHPIRVIWSVDGVFKGESDCDWTTVNGKIQRRPSVEQWRSAIRFILDNAKKLMLGDGSIKYGFEYLPKAVNKDSCSARGIETISEEYLRKFGKAPENFGKYPDDWVEPQPPMPPGPGPTPEPPAPTPPTPLPKKPWWHWLFGPNSLWAKFWRWIKT